MKRDELSKLYPRASQSFLDLNSADDNDSGLHPIDAKPNGRVSLDDQVTGEEAYWHEAARRFEIVFTVYSTHPCDWDGYDIKALQDFCVKAGLIPDDGWKTLSGRIVPKKVSKEHEEKTEITICACEW